MEINKNWSAYNRGYLYVTKHSSSVINNLNKATINQIFICDSLLKHNEFEAFRRA